METADLIFAMHWLFRPYCSLLVLRIIWLINWWALGNWRRSLQLAREPGLLHLLEWTILYQVSDWIGRTWSAIRTCATSRLFSGSPQLHMFLMRLERSEMRGTILWR